MTPEPKKVQVSGNDLLKSVTRLACVAFGIFGLVISGIVLVVDVLGSAKVDNVPFLYYFPAGSAALMVIGGLLPKKLKLGEILDIEFAQLQLKPKD